MEQVMKDNDIQSYIQMANFQAVLEIVIDVINATGDVVRRLFSKAV